ncbi:putative amino-acid permease [Mycobacterium antarcticum]|uniref:amino acid permease n=1 Tax=unclassified Mycolicibacterium TaxID=2636767 RepID=UPI00239E5503|nr:MULTISPECIES: amino acid permease [unclassified Mycolicibacterium]BDX30156.1 putative amino-acid permease [Mycolicibacterium sp. TUM20985]GLP73614.1 putative amino-acid permease [Mycolicibacterium sp. TUM20983]GLP79292.1 putative amino-acid permease [Mycolicibacterium sp. TUM20984]
MTDDQLSHTPQALPQTSDEDELRAFGYEPQLERSMGAWSSFSISISCMCVTAGVFTTYAYSLGMVGPVFVWTWLIVSIGQILVALVLAELAGRMPISGYAYQWTSRLINSHYGWFVGWAGLMAFIPGFTGLNFGLAPVLLNRLGIEITTTSTLIVVVVVLVSQLAINLAGVRVASRINNAVAFAVEIGLSIILTAILLIVGFVTNPVQGLSFLTTTTVDGNGFFTAILLSGLLAMWVLTGFEGAADLAEETKMATRHVPRAVMRALLFAIVVGFLMIVGLTINIDNLTDTIGSDVPVSHILVTALGPVGAAIFESVAIIALYAGGLANMAAASRLMFSLSRDNMLPASAVLKKVSPSTKSPSAALLVVSAMSLALVLVGTYGSSQAMALIVGMAALGYYAVYGLTVVAVLIASRNGSLPTKTSFDLGSYAGPVRVAALLWTLFVVGCLTIPELNHQTALMAGAFFVLAGIWYATVLRHRIREDQAGVPNGGTIR